MSMGSQDYFYNANAVIKYRIYAVNKVRKISFLKGSLSSTNNVFHKSGELCFL